MRDAAECFELHVALFQQLRDRMRREHLRREPFDRRLRCHGFRAVLAELGGMPVAVWIRPRAARTVEAVLLVQLEQRVNRAADAHLLDTEMRGFINGVEACRGRVTPMVRGAAGFERRLSSIDALREMCVRIGRLYVLGLVRRVVLVMIVKVHAHVQSTIAARWTTAMARSLQA